MSLFGLNVLWEHPFQYLPFQMSATRCALRLRMALHVVGKVLTRHFDYTYFEQIGLNISIYIVVTDASDREIGARMKA